MAKAQREKESPHQKSELSMSYRFILLFLSATACFSINLKAQDPQFSQFYAAPLFLNPAFTGATPSARVGTIIRDQWPAIKDASFISSSTYFDYFFDEYNSGLGAVFNVDRQGAIGPVSTEMILNYAYQIRLSETLTLRPGASIGLAIEHINFNKLIFPDDQNELVGDNQTKVYPDLSLGGLLYSTNFWVGISAFHLNTPNQAFLEITPDSINTRLPIKFSIHGGYRIPLYMPGSNRPGFNRFGKERSISPAFLYKRQGKFSSMELGVYTTLEPIVVGLWYRGTPGGLSPDDSLEEQFLKNDAIIFLLGIKVKNLKIGYSYDYTISNLQIPSGGAHEVSVTYEFQLGKKLPPRNVRQIPCPSF
ncbi:PorP/SprF family type IX secretion system membrane protein [Xanthovirga aplysinae]|uniref:PorP/SprF family type IX secretion system membrane protein n=1 Tax=Xanthovirga aplysinae TaxID=2529853 RepID=UPI0012BD0D11|nr:type IX secretion system membrane protein PorP/SprF [Xanthovirga aplysinae]MTI30124.1 type IX secretion system membrane protein PorP/SprF [Xanthovirga aplysinae]